MSYKLPEALGGWPVSVVDANGHGEVMVKLTDGPLNGLILGVSMLVLIVVPPPIPAEPEPGAYLIGDVLVVRFAGDDTERPWACARRGAVGGFEWWDWATAWKHYGGPDVTIRRLVPEPGPQVQSNVWACPAPQCGYHIADGPVPDGEDSTDESIRQHMEGHGSAQPEPGSGAYLIGGVLCVSFETDNGNDWTAAFPDGDGDTNVSRYHWAGLWKELAGPDVSIVPLSPTLPEVQLPWRGYPLKERDAIWADLIVQNVRPRSVAATFGAQFAELSPDTAEAMAAALLTAARAAREVS